MNTMEPTNELRYKKPANAGCTIHRVLQQKWVGNFINSGEGTLPKQIEEWRDIPEITEL